MDLLDTCITRESGVMSCELAFVDGDASRIG